MSPIFERFWQCCQLFKTLLVVENCINRRLELIFHCLRSVMDFGLNLTCSQNCHHAINKYLINFVKINNVMNFSSVTFILVFISPEIWLVLVKAFVLCLSYENRQSCNIITYKTSFWSTSISEQWQESIRKRKLRWNILELVQPPQFLQWLKLN